MTFVLTITVYTKIAMPLLLTGRLKLVHEFLVTPAVADLGTACVAAGWTFLLTALLWSIAGTTGLLTLLT